ncbi:MAG: class I SAM-dependent methyltransferase [Phycisphaerae bacterium]|nr:class I SAM-dependent methyltransferase [Phycisphaerae bacterium]
MSRVSDHYSGETGRAYAESKQLNPNAIGYQLNFEYFKPYLKSTDSLLDFGCGNGGMLLHMKQCVREVTGLEVNSVAREIAQKQGLRVFAGLDEVPTVPTYDVVTSNHVLEHVRDVCATLERLRMAMKPGALLVVKLPFDDIHEKKQREWSANDLDFHLHTFSVRNFANVLIESGFKVERCNVVTSCWHPKLFPLRKVGLDRLAYWAMAVLKCRRQIFAVGRVP